MQVDIKDIKVKKRVRKDMGDLDELKDSMRRFGLLNPITINTRNELVAGHRRLEAAKDLGWQKIEAIIVKIEDRTTLLEMELDENTMRKSFTQDELIEGYETLEKLRNPSFFTKIKMWFSNFFKKHFDSKEEKRTEKRRRNGFLSILCILGIAIIVLGAILSTHAIISSPLHTILDISGFIIFVIGLFFAIKFFIGIRK